MIACVQVPHPEHFRAKKLALHADPIQQGILQEGLLDVLEINDTPVEKNGTSEAYIVDLVDPGLVKGLAREDRVEPKVVLHDDVQKVLVKIVAHHEGNSSVRFTSMVEQKWLEELKFSDGVVTCPCSLHSFSAGDPNTNMRFHNHSNIVSSVAYSKGYLVRESLSDHLHDIAFLLG